MTMGVYEAIAVRRTIRDVATKFRGS